MINPELPKDLAADKGLTLDVLVELEDGRIVDVEMQCDGRGALGARWLYHWARLFSSTLRRGEKYERLEPVVCIVFLAARTPANRFHSIYEAREIHDNVRLSDALAIHVIELPKLELAAAEGEGVDPQRWARFLRFEDERELDSLASETPIMADAKHALEILSREPTAQQLAELRREAEVETRLERMVNLAEGRKLGREEGLVEGRAELAREGIERMCRALNIELSPERVALLVSRSGAELEAAFDWLIEHRSWPDRLPSDPSR